MFDYMFKVNFIIKSFNTCTNRGDLKGFGLLIEKFEKKEYINYQNGENNFCYYLLPFYFLI